MQKCFIHFHSEELNKNPQIIHVLAYRGGGEILPGKINFGKILSEISGQYFYRGFKPRDKIFPLFLRKVQFHLVIVLKYKPKISFLRAEFSFYPSKPRGDRIFTPF